MNGLKVARKEERNKYEKATLAIAVSIFLQAVIVCIFRVPLVVGYTMLFVSVAIACYCIEAKEASHEEAMGLWAQLKA
ncbi:MAG: hypothetical protein HFJ36_03785 [Clostridia bacterium]|nr:hypothetical protein [Clostridia bacterium]